MSGSKGQAEQGFTDPQRAHWESTYQKKPGLFGHEPSYAARKAAVLFQQTGKHKLLELGSGQGRDTLFLAASGFEVQAPDYSALGLQAIFKAARGELDRAVTVRCHDVRQPLPFADDSFDACFSHMLYCMAFTTTELDFLSSEIHRVLKPGGLNVYTVRNTHDPAYGTGIHRGEDMYELDGGFIVHFFSREVIQRLAGDVRLLSVEEFEEGRLPKRLSLVSEQEENGHAEAK